MKHFPVNGLSRSAEFVRTIHFAPIPAGVTLDMVLKPPFWAHHVNRLQVNDVIEAVSEDGSFDAELRVVAKAPGFARVRVLRVWQSDEAPAVVAPEGDMPVSKDLPRIEFTKTRKFRLLGFDGSEVKTGIPSRGEAERELAAYKAAAGV